MAAGLAEWRMGHNQQTHDTNCSNPLDAPPSRPYRYREGVMGRHSTAPVLVSWATAKVVRFMHRVGGPKPKRQPVFDTSNMDQAA